MSQAAIRTVSPGVLLILLIAAAVGCQKKSGDESKSGMLADSGVVAGSAGRAIEPGKAAPVPIERTPAAEQGDTRPPAMVQDTVSGQRPTAENRGKPVPIPQESRQGAPMR